MIHIYTDASGAYGDVCCISYVVVDDGRVKSTNSATVGNGGRGAHNIAEHQAVFDAIKHAIREKYTDVTIHSDSQSVVNHVIEALYNGKSANGRYAPIVDKIVELSKQFDHFKITWEPRTNPFVMIADEHCRLTKRSIMLEKFRRG